MYHFVKLQRLCISRYIDILYFTQTKSTDGWRPYAQIESAKVDFDSDENIKEFDIYSYSVSFFFCLLSSNVSSSDPTASSPPRFKDWPVTSWTREDSSRFFDDGDHEAQF